MNRCWFLLTLDYTYSSFKSTKLPDLSVMYVNRCPVLSADVLVIDKEGTFGIFSIIS